MRPPVKRKVKFAVSSEALKSDLDSLQSDRYSEESAEDAGRRGNDMVVHLASPPARRNSVISRLDQAFKPHVLFTFFEALVTPPNFASFEAGFEHVENVMSSHPQFCSSFLLSNLMQPETSQHQRVQIALFDTLKTNKVEYDESWLSAIRVGYADSQGQVQGSFTQLHSVELRNLPDEEITAAGPRYMMLVKSSDRGEGLTALRTPHRIQVTLDENVTMNELLPLSNDTVYLISVFRPDGDAQRLEATWPIWTGANVLLRHPRYSTHETANCSGGAIHMDLFACLRRLTFYKRNFLKTKYSYIMVCEFVNASHVLFRIKDLVLRLGERQCGQVGAYQVVGNKMASRFTNVFNY